MADISDKENASPLRLRRSASPIKSTSPPKPTRKARSKSIGPEELEVARQKSPDRSRRRSAMTQVIQLPPAGILPSKDEAQKRKEARRKSLANRRVSFAPEATLHTWDVIEYMRDATASSSASSNGRPSFAPPPARHSWEQESDPPSTPPEQADDDDDDLPAEPEHQRDVHQKKRRRSSVIPPMNFNNPDDDFSSSPVSGSSVVEGSSEMGSEDEEEDGEEYESEDDGESTAMSLDTGDHTAQSEGTDSTDSSLTARLRQASELAGTRGIVYDEHGEEYQDGDEDQDESGDQTVEMDTQEVTGSFKPWVQRGYGPPPMAKNIIALQDQENMNPFSPAFRNAFQHRKPQGVPSTVGEVTEMMDSEDMSMDMTRAVGGILQSNHPAAQLENDENDSNDMSMDITRAVGGILHARQSQLLQSPAQHADEDEADENDMTMDMTQAIGGILQSQLPLQQARLQGISEAHGDDDESNDMTMDMTMAVGGILSAQPARDTSQDADDQTSSLDDQTMEFTQAIGRIIQPSASRVAPPRSAMKRKHAATENGSPLTNDKSPAQRPQRRTAAEVTAKRRRSSATRSSLGGATMDFTMVVGGIRPSASPVKQDRRASLRRRRSSGMSSAMDEQTMDFTAAIGGIKQKPAQLVEQPIEEESVDENEELSIEFSAVTGGVGLRQSAPDVQRPSTPKESFSPTRTEVPTTPNREGHFRLAEDQSAKKLLTPMFEQSVDNSAVKDSAGSRLSSVRSVKFAEKSPASVRKTRASARKSLASPLKGASPQEVQNVGSKSPVRARETPTSASKSPVRALRGSSSPQKGGSKKSPFVDPPSPTSDRKNPISASKSPASAKKTPAITPESLAPSKSPASARKSPGSVRKHRQSSAPSAAHSQESPADVETLVPADEVTESFSPGPGQEMDAEPAGEVVYPSLPAPESMDVLVPTLEGAATPPQATVASQSHHQYTVSEAGSPLPASVRTPEAIDMEVVYPPSPSLEKQIRSSPVKNSMTPQQHATPAMSTPQQSYISSAGDVATPRGFSAPDASSMTPQPGVAFEEPSRAFSSSLKLMSTPRKDTGTTPLKRLRGMTPMKSPAKKAMTPKRIATPKAKTPQATVKSSAAELAGQQLAQELFAATQTGQQLPRIKLNDFLDKAGIKFMELALPTKRRFTVAPGSLDREATADAGNEAAAIDLESAIVAGACTMPMLDLFQHSCRELKRYISEGKAFVKTLDGEVYADPPPLISAYVSAEPGRKAQLDSHMRDIKTHARLRSKEVWYDWRGKLLDGLSEGLEKIKHGLDEDAKVLGDREKLLDTLLPDLLLRHESLEQEAVRLEEAAAATSEEEREELDAARQGLLEVNAQIEERKRMLESFRQDLQQQDALVEAYEEGKAECLAQIREADRVKESCRGWSTDEVSTLKTSVSHLEKQTGWTISSASGSALTMTYRSSLSLFFDTSAFLSSSTTAEKKENQPISLTYIGNSQDASKPLTTEKRFFLQLLRAQLQCLEQRGTRIRDLLNFVAKGWDVASTISESIRGLRIEYPVAVAILSDERLGIMVDVLLPKVQTKVRVAFEIGAGVEGLEGGAMEVKTGVQVTGRVIYGEGYNERNMEGFLGRRCGELGQGWVEGVRELRVKLVATGRKGRG